ncbi:hypothetical protein [Absidia glauca]|uniref:Uncharacterized protein n=1 Tax=Absidia glauca TaxID=4829 RepID=A0A163JLM9_ABSGL|nr:hypothetical protein [Absidia glauca]
MGIKTEYDTKFFDLNPDCNPSPDSKACLLTPKYLFNPLSLGVNCGRNGNSDTVCSPIHGDTWRQNGTYYLATWNPTYPTYVASMSLSIYIYFIEHYQKINVMSFHNISNTGEYPILMNSSWFDPSLKLQDSPNHDARFYLISTDVNPVTEMSNLNSAWPQPVHFSVLESSSSSTPNNQGTNSPPNQSASGASESASVGTSPWVAPLLVVGCILLLVGCIAAFCMMRMVRRRKLVFDEKGQLEQSSTIHPSSSDQFFLKHHRDDDRQQQQQTMVSSSYPNLSSIVTAPHPAALQSMTNLSSRSDPPLTSTDALLIADTFRQRMRRPEWPHCNDIVQPSSSSSKSAECENIEDEDEELKRRLASELLLKNELEAEGTLMKKVGKRAHLLSTIQYDPPSMSPPPS